MSVSVRTLRCGSVRLPGHGRVPVWCYLVEHPELGRILIDAGTANVPLPLTLRMRMRPEVEQPVGERLRALGLFPEDLDAVLLTGLDADHTGGLSSLQGVGRVLVPEEEYFWASRSAFSRDRPRSLWEGLPLETFYFRGSAEGPAGHAACPLGTDTLTAVLAPGHSFGCCCYLLRSNSRCLVFAGSAMLSVRRGENDTVYHPHRQEATAMWLRDAAKDSACAGVFTTHDPEERERVFFF